MYSGAQNISLAIEYKKLLNDIIDVAYGNDRRLPQYKQFKVYLKNEKPKNRLGEYIFADSSVTAFYTNSTTKSKILITLIHEASHHIEYKKTGQSGHQASFYEIHKKLLFAAFDMNVLKPEDVIRSERSIAQNNNKLSKMIEKEYEPHPIAYKTNSFAIRVYDAYEHKDVLKGRGYKYYATDQSWGKMFPENCNEIAELISLGIPMQSIRVIDGSAPANKLKVKIKIKNSNLRYSLPEQQRTELKNHGYRWDAIDYGWTKMTFINNLANEILYLSKMFYKSENISLTIDFFNVWFTENPDKIRYYNNKSRSNEITTPEEFVKLMYN